MKHLKLFENFQESICKKYGITNYNINSDGSIDVEGDVNLYSKNLTKLPLKFGRVNGNFDCGNNNLTTLEGCPTHVGGNFDCGYNNLTTLEGCPTHVGGYFYCGYNNLTTLEGCPTHIGGYFNCGHNQLTTLDGCCESISGNFLCDNNPVYELWKLFGNKNDIEFFNHCQPVHEGKVILFKLNWFLEYIKKPTVKSVKGYECI